MRKIAVVLAALVAVGLPACSARHEVSPQPTEPRRVQQPLPTGARMDWWREARFGMFIHWGLYSIPAGEWQDRTDYGEWIRDSAHIPLEQYDQFVKQFNPVKFNADQWVRTAKAAGVKYIVITSKHHDGFCLFDSKYTDFDVMSTPFKRDIMKELAEACRREGLRICWYHSIMDWHHPDYLPRRKWEKRSAEGADFNRYVAHLKNQVKELLTNYGDIGIMWFDGEWEDTWNHQYGQDLYDYVRSLQPNVIVNNRVDKGRGGMGGLSDAGFAGDYGTPEQEIPPTGLPGVDWETCMTMNDHWGYNKHDQNWKSSESLIRMLIDIASKGGNFLLNVGPTSEGEIPQPSVERLAAMGRWMQVNGESIYGTRASPFKTLPWGRCTQRRLPDGGTRLYLHVFEWPAAGRLVLPGIVNEARRAYLLSDARQAPLPVSRQEDALVVQLAGPAPDPVATVVALEIAGLPDVVDPPTISAASDIFIDMLDIAVSTNRDNVEFRCTTDGTDPTVNSRPIRGRIHITGTVTYSVRAFSNGRPISPLSSRTFTKVTPIPAERVDDATGGLEYEYYEGPGEALPDFSKITPIKTGAVAEFDLSPRANDEHFAFRYRGFVNIPADGVYTFYTASDDGSRLYIGDTLIVDNDGLHGTVEKAGQIALAAGLHPITVTYFNCTGDRALQVSYAGPGIDKQIVQPELLWRGAAAKGTDSTTASPTAQQGEAQARPTPEQIAWHDAEIGMFIHFAPNTYTDQEYDDLSLPLEKFNPTQLDTDQWVGAAQALGAKYIVFVTKHAGGFCMWPTETTDYSIKSTPWRGGKGDVLGDLAGSCRKRGMKLGVYVSPCDRKHGAEGGGQCKTPEAQETYNQLYRRQLTEVLSRYGEMSEVWFDGSIVVPVGDILTRYAPRAMIFQGPHATIRWVGNEDGVAPYPAWNALAESDARTGEATAAHGNPQGLAWLPLECDARMRNTWFWNTKNADTLKTVEQLMDMYYRSVGQGAVLLLNHTPDTTGRIPEADVKRGAEFAAEVQRRFGQSIAETTGGGNLVELPLPSPGLIDHVITMEDIAQGERVREYVIEALAGGEWKPLCRGTAIGHKKIDRFSPVEAAKVRLRVTVAAGTPQIRRFAAYCTGRARYRDMIAPDKDSL
ncbi:MAG TPA: alpha-L-fucosidase [Phycisphaerae bacterium]|nr:alpha-L-fucosidase [Phycisphaerae bacterium]